MTTPNHSMVAGMVAVAVSEATIETKAAVAITLLFGHFVLDLVPHKHWWGNLRDHDPLASSNRLLVCAEVVTGLVAVPLLIWQLFGASLWMVGLYALAANLPDFLAPFFKPVSRLNTLVHWWEYTLPLRIMKGSELVQSVLLLVLTFTLWAS